MGPEIRELEEKLAAYVGVKHAVGCASGTDALLMALMAYGVGPGDAIFTTPFTFVATAEVISILGATPIFVDIDPFTFNIDPVKLEAAIEALKKRDASFYPLPFKDTDRAVSQSIALCNEKLSALKPRGVIAVDLFGLPADYDVINGIARRGGLFVIEDAAQSFGAEYKGRKACSLADIACTSFFPAKPLGCYGDGGMCFTDDDNLVQIMRSIRVHGQGTDKYENVRIGINGRLDTMQAAILLAKFSIFPEEVDRRQTVAWRYDRLLKSLEADAISGTGEERQPADAANRPSRPVTPPMVPPGYKSVWAQYSVLTTGEERRAAYQHSLKEAGIPTAIYYPLPLHLQKAFACLGYKAGDFPESETAARRIFSIPMHPYLNAEVQEKICQILQISAGK